MTPTLAEYAKFAQMIAAHNAMISPEQTMRLTQTSGSFSAVFILGCGTTQQCNKTYTFTTPLDCACVHQMMTAAAVVAGDREEIFWHCEYEAESFPAEINPYDGSEAEQEMELMDRRCRANASEAKPTAVVEPWQNPYTGWRMALYTDCMNVWSK
jgi:hypothetical protein